MNRVYISGKIAESPLMRMDGGIAHLTALLRVSHRTHAGIRKSEDYRINAWNRIAQWGMANLERGQVVAVQGYLTQNHADGNTTEITVEEFLPVRVPAPSAVQVSEVEMNERTELEPGIVPETRLKGAVQI